MTGIVISCLVILCFPLLIEAALLAVAAVVAIVVGVVALVGKVRP